MNFMRFESLIALLAMSKEVPHALTKWIEEEIGEERRGEG